MKTKFLKLVLIFGMITAVFLSPQIAGAATKRIYEYFISNGEAVISDCVTSVSGELIIPDTLDGYPVTGFRMEAFWGCSELTGITIPDSVTGIAPGLFGGCSNLTNITLPEKGMWLDSGAFESTEYYKNKSNWVDGVLYIGKHLIEVQKSVIGDFKIREGTKSIGDAAFYGCSGITNVIIPGSVEYIGSSAFAECTGLTSVVIPDGVTNIGGYAFSGCSGLTSITIPDSVTETGYKVISGCRNLENVISNRYKLLRYDSGEVDIIKPATIYAPDGRTTEVAASEVETYKTLGWFEYPVVYVVSKSDETILIAESDFGYWKNQGWTSPVKLYNTNDEVVNVHPDNAQRYKAMGWFEYPVMNVGNALGECMTIAKTDFDYWKNQGWSDKITIYSPSETKATIPFSEISAYKAVGWYTYPVIIVHNVSNQSIVIAESEYDNYKARGWYKKKDWIWFYHPEKPSKQVHPNGVIEDGWYTAPVLYMYDTYGKKHLVYLANKEWMREYAGYMEYDEYIAWKNKSNNSSINSSGGSTYKPKVYEDCSSCKGSGRKICTRCNGDGNISAVDMYGFALPGQNIHRFCESCNGNGYKMCTSCDGTGKK